MVRCFLLLLAAATAWAPLAAASTAGAGPTVKDVVEFTRIIQPADQNRDDLRKQVAPDGRRAFIVTRKADVRTDTNLFEILLVDVAADRLAAAGNAAAARRLLTIASPDDHDFYQPSIEDAQWVGNRTIVFKGRMGGAGYQVYALDVDTRRLTPLTRETRMLVSFAVTGDLRRVVYAVLVPNPPMQPGERSIVVGNNSFWTVMHGQDDWQAQLRRYQYFVADAGSRRPARPLGEPFALPDHKQLRPSIAPDGRWVLLHRWDASRQLAWARQYPMVAEATELGPSLSLDPLGYFSRPYHYVTRRAVAYRLSDGLHRPVLDAPDDALPGQQGRADRVWQDGGRSVVIAGTFLPAPPGGEADPASHIVEYWPDADRWAVVARLQRRLAFAHEVPGRPGSFVAMDGERHRRFERRADGSWQELDAAAAPAAAGDVRDPPSRGWTLAVQQALNQPPDVVALGPAGESRRLTDLNPAYAPASWGAMRPYAWKDAQGRQWNGGLMLPPGFEQGRRYPLVIQTYGFVPGRFYVDGSNIADGFTSGFAGRAFLREGMLVLAVPNRPASGAPADLRGAIDAFSDAVAGAVRALADAGLVDTDRIGLLGFSRTGEEVLDLVTFSDAPIRAATLLDGSATTLFSATITYGASDNIVSRKEKKNEGPPFGPGRDAWLRHDPSLHTECIRAALRIESYGPWVKNNWDIHALLRRQYKAAEMVVFPRGTHNLSRPSERMISLQGNVDWYRFWLKGEERSEPVLRGETEAALREQYMRWRQMAELKQVDDARPRCTSRPARQAR